MNKKKWTEEQLKEAVLSSQSIREVLKKLGLKEAGGNYAIIKWWIAKLGIDKSAILGQAHRKGKKYVSNHQRPLTEVMVENSNYQSFKLRNRLIKEGILPAQCNKCKGTNWLDGKIPLELEHKNGNKFDNRMENLELLCPNCHALTSTYRGKNKAINKGA